MKLATGLKASTVCSTLARHKERFRAGERVRRGAWTANLWGTRGGRGVNWTATLPVEPGYYWVSEAGRDPQVVRLSGIPGYPDADLVATTTGNVFGTARFLFREPGTRWAGPIPMPTEG